jgi:ectoine hydroxylase-related dioxygenase (phytanoyl-CoA dioxygenase family)
MSSDLGRLLTPQRAAPAAASAPPPPPAAGEAVLPAPSRDLAQGLRDIERFGMAIVPQVLSGATLARTREALYRAAESDRSRGRESKFSLDYEHDSTNQRVWNVLSRDPLFEDMAFHRIAVDYVKAVLGWPALLGNISANITGPGGGEMVLHADQIFVPEPWSAEPQGLNVAWCLDDFTEENGATRFVPGSHRLNRAPREDEADVATVPIEAEAGSVVVFESRVWHKTGHNRTKDETRAGVFGWYTKPIYRAQENWFLSLKPEIARFASEEALVLLGYKAEGLGLVYGASPR